MLCNKYMGLMMSKMAWAIVPGSTSAAFANDWQHCAVTEPVVRKSSTNSLANYLRQRLRCYTRTCETPRWCSQALPPHGGTELCGGHCIEVKIYFAEFTVPCR